MGNPWVYQQSDKPSYERQLGAPASEGGTHTNIIALVLPTKHNGDLVPVHSLAIGLGWFMLLSSPLLKLVHVGRHCNQIGRSPTK